jgi:hypothetical protein
LHKHALLEVYTAAAPKHCWIDPATGVPEAPRLLGGPGLDDGVDGRAALAEWLTRRDNPLLAKALVNRVWAHYFGRGLAEPSFTLGPANPAVHAELLDELARDFVENRYDFRRLERLILQARVYQLSPAVNDTNKHDKTLFARAYFARPHSRVLADLVADALDLPHDEMVPKGTRAIEATFTSPVVLGFGVDRSNLEQQGDELAQLFGRMQTMSRCSEGRGWSSFLSGSSEIEAKLKRSKRLKTLAADPRPLEETTGELFLAMLGRLPRDSEMQIMRRVAQDKADQGRHEILQQFAWALLNTREFMQR